VVLLNIVVSVGLSQSALLSPVNVLTPLTAGTAAATSAAKPTPNYSNVYANSFCVVDLWIEIISVIIIPIVYFIQCFIQMKVSQLNLLSC